MSDTQKPHIHLRLKRFELDRIRPGNTVVLIGMRETGKTVIAKDILWHNRDIPSGTVICGTPDTDYKKITPPQICYDEYTPEIPRAVAKRQKALSRKDGISDNQRKHFFVMDDCLYDSSWIRDRYVRYILFERRHLQTLFILTMQYGVGLPPEMCAAFDYVFILRENIVSNRRRLFNLYASTVFPDFDVFCQVLNEVFHMNPYDYKSWQSCLVIDNTTDSLNIEDRVFHFTATLRPDLRLCDEHYWTVKESESA